MVLRQQVFRLGDRVSQRGNELYRSLLALVVVIADTEGFGKLNVWEFSLPEVGDVTKTILSTI